jgi:hypothetical protein
MRFFSIGNLFPGLRAAHLALCFVTIRTKSAKWVAVVASQKYPENTVLCLSVHDHLQITIIRERRVLAAVHQHGLSLWLDLPTSCGVGSAPQWG